MVINPVTLPLANQEVLHAYAAYLNDLLELKIALLNFPDAQDWFDLARIQEATRGSDLVLVNTPRFSFKQRLFIADPVCWLSAHFSKSILVISKPRHPIRRLLLVIRNEASEKAANWASRIALKSHAVVTILPIVAPAPNFLSVSADPKAIQSQLLTSSSLVGRTLQQLMQDLARRNIRCELAIKRGVPYQQITQAIDDNDHDLIIAAADKSGWSNRLLLGSFTPTLLRCRDRSILLAKTD